MSQVDWEGLKALEAKATQGNWWFSKIYGDLIDYKDNEFLAGPFRNDNDALFIAKFREQFPAILAEVEQLKMDSEAKRESLEHLLERHERDQRVIQSAEKLIYALENRTGLDNMLAARVEYDKAKAE